MGLSCRCCKKKGRCACKACPTIASESLALEIDYKQFDIDGQPFDSREDVPNGPLFGPEPPYPEGFEINATCGYAKPKVTSDREQGINGCGEPYPPFEDPLPCGEFAATMTDPETGEPYEVICPEGYTCDGAKLNEAGSCEPIPGEVNLSPECLKQYDKYTCEGNGPRMGRAGPSKKSTFFGIGLIPENRDLIECTDGQTCPQGYECVESTDPPEKIKVKDPLPEPTPCDDDDPFVLDCPTGYECQCGKCEPEKVDAPIKSYCKLEKTPCSIRVPCPEGYECVTNPDTDESFCEPLSGELTKDFLQHPIQAQFGLFPCKNPHKNEVCAPQDVPEPCDIPDCIPPIGKLPDQCEKCTDNECEDHFGDGYKCNRDGDCEKEDANPCPEGYECRPDPSNPIVQDFPSEVELPFGYIGCIDTDCEKEYGPGFKCNNNGNCEIDPEDGTDTNCELLFGGVSEYYPTKPILDTNGNKVVYDINDPNAPSCSDLTKDLGFPDSIEEDGECHQIIPNCQKIPTNCLPIEIANEPDWIFVENSGLPVFLVPTDGLPYGPLPLDGEGGARKRRYDELWKGDDTDKLPKHIGACNGVDVNNGECTPDCCYETFGDPWLPNHEWKCRQRKIFKELEPLEQPCGEGEETKCPLEYTCQDGNCKPVSCDDDGGCPPDHICVNGQCRDKDAFVPQNDDSGEVCYLEPIDPYSNKEDDLDSLIRDFPKVREFECPAIDQNCDFEPCPGGYICENSRCVFDCEAKYGLGAKCEEGYCQPPCSDDVCEEEYGVGFKCNRDGNCELVRDRDLDSRIPRPIGEEPTYNPRNKNDELYFGHTSAWGGNNNNKFGVGVFNIDTTKIRTRLYLDYGYHLHYPFDKGHMNTELVPSGCPVEKTPKTDVWKYKGNKGHRHPYPKVNTIAIGNRYPSTHSFIDDEEHVDDFTKVGSGPYFGEYCDRAMGTEEPGGLLGLGDPAPTNRNPETKTHENDDYSPKKDPNGVVKGCDPAFVVPCDTNPEDEIEFDYLAYVRTDNEDMMEDDGLNRTGVCTKDMDDWRVSNQSVFSHTQVPSGPVGGLIIDKVKFIPVDYHFPSHTTSPDMWLWPGFTEYGESSMQGNVTKNNRVEIPATTLPVYMAVYYNSKIGHKPIRYDDPDMDINQFLPPPNGWLENIWQLGDIANPLDVDNVQPHGSVLYSRPANTPDYLSGLTNARRGYKYWAMGNQDYIDKYDHLPVDRHWDMPSKDTCESDLPEIETTCTDLIVASRWINTETPCADESDCSDDADRQCVCEGELPDNNWQVGDQSSCRNPDGSSGGVCWSPPAEMECTDEYCEETFGDGSKCDGDGNCTYTGCPEGYKCGCPEDPDPNPLVEPLPPQGAVVGLNIYEIEMEVSYVSSIPNPDFDPGLDPPDPNILPTIDGPIIKTKLKPTRVTGTGEDEKPSSFWQGMSNKVVPNPFEPLSMRKNFHQAINHGIDTPYWDEYYGDNTFNNPALPSLQPPGGDLPFFPVEGDEQFANAYPFPIQKDLQLFKNDPPEDELYLEYYRKYNEDDWLQDMHLDRLSVSFDDLPDDVGKVIDVKVKVRHKGSAKPDTTYHKWKVGEIRKSGGTAAVAYSLSSPSTILKDDPLSNEIPFWDGTLRYNNRLSEEYGRDFGFSDGNFYFFADYGSLGEAGAAARPLDKRKCDCNKDDVAKGLCLDVNQRCPQGYDCVDGFCEATNLTAQGYESVWIRRRAQPNKIFMGDQRCPGDINSIEPQWGVAPPLNNLGSCVCDSSGRDGHKYIFSGNDSFEQEMCVLPNTDVLSFQINPEYTSKSDWDGFKFDIQPYRIAPTCYPLTDEGFEYVQNGKIVDENGDPVSCNDDPDTDCEEKTGVPGSKCYNGVCFAPPTCEKANRYCVPCDPCDCGTEEGFHLQSCGDHTCDGEPVPCGDDVKLTKHLFDFWNDGTPFPSNNGDVTDGHLTWFPAQLDQYGEVQLKPFINTRERDIQSKWPERNLFGVKPPDPKDNPEPCGCGDEPCPPGFYCKEDLCIPGEGSLISTVTYPPLLYTGLVTGGYKTQCGVKNNKTSDDRAIKQWWFEQPYHPGNPDQNWSIIGGIYSKYLAQIGVPLDYHSYDQDWLDQQFEDVRHLQSHAEERPPRPRGDDHPDVREVYRNAVDPVKWNAKTRTWIGGDPGREPNSDRSMVGQPTGSYHGRDGMLRYNIHPWAQIYDQMRITDSLLEMGRDFHEVQKVLSSIELECKNGVFKNGTPTVVERFGYGETGNIQFQLNQPHGSHFAELTTPRILNYRPTAIMPPGNATQIKIGGPGHAMCTYEYLYPMTVGGKTMWQIFRPGGEMYGPASLAGEYINGSLEVYGEIGTWGPQPFISRVLGRPETYPGYELGASATSAEESFTDGVVETEFGPVEFYITANLDYPSFMNITPYFTSGQSTQKYDTGKVYGASKWPYDTSNNHIVNPHGINGERYGDGFYIGGHGYFDPTSLQEAGLQNLDPDMGLFTYCFIAGMNDTASLPGLPKGWTFGMVGGSFHSEFNHHVSNGYANAPYWNRGDFQYPWLYYPGTTNPIEPNYGPVDFLQKKKDMGTFGSHYFDKYDYPGDARDARTSPSLEANIDVTYTIDGIGEFRHVGNIVTGTLIDLSRGCETDADCLTGQSCGVGDYEGKCIVQGANIHGNRASTALVKHFMAEDMTNDPTEFLKQYYYAQVVKVRADGPITNTALPMDNMFDVAELEAGDRDVHLILKREGDIGRLIEGPQAKTWLGLPEAPRYYKTAKYQRLEGEECVDTYDKECAVGGSSACGDTSGGGLLPANVNSAQNGIMDQIITLPPDKLAGLEHILPLVTLDNYLVFDSDGEWHGGIKDLDLYYITNQYGSDGSIAPNGQIITDEFLRNLYPEYFYDADGDPTRVSLHGAVLDRLYVLRSEGTPAYQTGAWEYTGRIFFSVGNPNIRPDFAKQEYICAKMTDPATGLHNSELERDMNAITYGAADMNKCIKTSRFYSGERSDFVPLYGNITWSWYGAADVPPAQAAASWEPDDKDILGVTPFHWPWAIGDLCVDWAAGSPKRGGNMGVGIDERHGFNHKNALENVKEYYYNFIDRWGPQDNKDLERTVAYNEFPNSYEAELYKLAIISGTTNAGDMEFISDSHRQKNDILQAKPPCKLWTNIHDFKWPLTPATGINTPITDRCDRVITPEDTEESESTGGTEEGESRVNTVHGKLKINISEKPIIRFRAGGVKNKNDEGPDKLWFTIDDNDAHEEDIEEHDPPVPCDPNTDCGDDYECREIEGCDDTKTYCMPKKCIPTPRKKPIKEYREELGFHHLVLQPTTNPVLDNHIRCPLHHVDIPHWGPQVQLKSALFNRDLITIDECSACDIDCDCREPGDPEPLPPLDPEQICGRWDGDEECPDGYDCLCHTCQQEPFKKCLKADAYGCRRCLTPTSPTITITEPVDYSASIFDPGATPNGFAQNCAIYIDILDNNGNDDPGCGSDQDCYSAVDPTVARYSNFREQYPYITTDEIRCGDPCQFLNICPPGFTCNEAGDFCDPIPFTDIPLLNGTVDIKVDVTPGAGGGTAEDSNTSELTKFKVKRVVFTTVQLQTEDPNANDYLKPIISTTLAVEGVELEDGVWGMEWDTIDPSTGYTPDGIFEIKAAIYDTGDLRCLDIATVRLGEDD